MRIIFSRSRSLGSVLIRAGSWWGAWSHCSLLVPGGLVIESVAARGGVVITPLHALLARVDVAVSTRNATAPDNAGIAATQAAIAALPAPLNATQTQAAAAAALVAYDPATGAELAAVQGTLIAEIESIPAPDVPTAAENAVATVAAINLTPPQVDVRKINGAAVVGDGSQGNKWRGSGV